MSFLLPLLYEKAGLDNAMQVQAGGYAATMESGELLMFLMGGKNKSKIILIFFFFETGSLYVVSWNAGIRLRA